MLLDLIGFAGGSDALGACEEGAVPAISAHLLVAWLARVLSLIPVALLAWIRRWSRNRSWWFVDAEVVDRADFRGAAARLSHREVVAPLGRTKASAVVTA